MGYYLPWVLASGVLGLFGSGLISTMTPETKPIAWISYQIIAGMGRGCGTTMVSDVHCPCCLTETDRFLCIFLAYGGDAKYPLTRTDSTWDVYGSILPIVRRFHVPHVWTDHFQLRSCRVSKEICTYSRYTSCGRCWGCWSAKCGAALGIAGRHKSLQHKLHKRVLSCSSCLHHNGFLCLGNGMAQRQEAERRQPWLGWPKHEDGYRYVMGRTPAALSGWTAHRPSHRDVVS